MRHFAALAAASVWFMFGKTSLASSCFCVKINVLIKSLN